MTELEPARRRRRRLVRYVNVLGAESPGVPGTGPLDEVLAMSLPSSSATGPGCSTTRVATGRRLERISAKRAARDERVDARPSPTYRSSLSRSAWVAAMAVTRVSIQADHRLVVQPRDLKNGARRP